MKVPSMMSWIGVRTRVFGGFALVLSFRPSRRLRHGSGRANWRDGERLATSAAGDAGMSQVRAALLSANSAVEKIRPDLEHRRQGCRDAGDRARRPADRSDRTTVRHVAHHRGGRWPGAKSLETYRSSFAAATEAVDRLRAATTKTDAHGAVAGLNVGGIQVALANRSISSGPSTRCGSPPSWMRYGSR